jgi:nitric oxide reductase subunit B
LIAGYEQSFVERALEGSSWSGYFAAQRTHWFLQGMYWREVWGVVTMAGLGLLIWDLLTIGARETRVAPVLQEVPATA